MRGEKSRRVSSLAAQLEAVRQNPDMIPIRHPVDGRVKSGCLTARDATSVMPIIGR